MKVKVLLNNLRVDVKDAFARAEDYFKRHGVPVTFTFVTPSIKGYKSTLVTLSDNTTRYHLTGVEPLIKDYVDPAYDVTIFAFNGNEFKNIPTSNAYIGNGKPCVNFMTYKQGSAEEHYLTLIHEMMHAILDHFIVTKALVLDDVMDTYHNNDKPESDDSNFGKQWAILRPYFSQKPVVTITREKSSKVQTLGSLVANNGGAIFTCKTLELPWLENRKMISCIPPGTYEVKKVLWVRKLKQFYMVQNVPNRGGIFIHEGNFYFNYEGCIGLGKGTTDLNRDGYPDITSTVDTLKAFEGFMQNKPFTLIIK